VLAGLEAATRPAEAGGQPAATDLAGAVECLERVAKRRALVVLVTDFLAVDGWERPLARAALRHEMVAVHVSDPREGSIPDIGVVTFEDPETGAQITVDTSSRRLRARFEEAAKEQRSAIHERLRRCPRGRAADRH